MHAVFALYAQTCLSSKTMDICVLVRHYQVIFRNNAFLMVEDVDTQSNSRNVIMTITGT